MKRTLTALLTALVLLSAIPALAAGEQGAAVRVLGTDGTTTVGVRTTPDAGTPETDGTNTWPTDLVEPVYTNDGVTWKAGTWDEAPDSSLVRGGYNGSEFLLYEFASHRPDYRSKDGVRWTRIPADTTEDIPTYAPGSATVGPYHFELRDGDLWLVNGTAAALLPDVGKHRPEDGNFTDVQASYVPEGVRVEVTNNNPFSGTGEPYVVVYPLSSLDWVTEHQSTYDWRTEELESVNNGSIWVRKVSAGGNGERWEVGTKEADGDVQWQPITATWCQDSRGARLLPWNGKSFLILDNWSLQLYASEDGANWRCLRDTFLAPEREAGMHGFWPINTSSHVLTWTGGEYMACRRTYEEMYGMMGMGGGDWYSPYCSKVCFADESFGLTGEYDFGRQVEAVGYWNGAYYAEVSRSEGLAARARDENTAFYNSDAGTDIYRSTDKINWEKTELKQIFSSIHSLA